MRARVEGDQSQVDCIKDTANKLLLACGGLVPRPASAGAKQHAHYSRLSCRRWSHAPYMQRQLSEDNILCRQRAWGRGDDETVREGEGNRVLKGAEQEVRRREGPAQRGTGDNSRVL